MEVCDCDAQSEYNNDGIKNNNNFCNLLPDLLIDILCGLPEKDLFRCKSVSMAWYNLITFTCVPLILSRTQIACPSGFFFGVLPLPSPRVKPNRRFLPIVDMWSPPEIVAEYFHKVAYSSHKHVFVATGLDTNYFTKLKFIGRYVSSLLPFDHQSKDLIDVCNGLLLFVKPPSCQLYVCNPTTKQCISIPKLCDHRPCISRFAMLAFDPLVSSHYKIVRFPLFDIGSLEDILSLDLDIFSSETGFWVRQTVQLNQTNNLHAFCLVKNSVYLRGVLYRLLSFKSRKLVKVDLNDVDSIDIQIIDLPVKDKLAVPGCIGISKGNLSYAHREPDSFCIWHLDEVGNWISDYFCPTPSLERYIISTFYRILARYERTTWLSPYAMHPTDDIIFVGCHRLILALNLKTGTLDMAYTAGALMLVPGIFHPVFVYNSCAVPLKKFGPRTTQKVVYSCNGQLRTEDTCSDDSEQCCELPETDNDIYGLSPEFWVGPTLREHFRF